MQLKHDTTLTEGTNVRTVRTFFGKLIYRAKYDLSSEKANILARGYELIYVEGSDVHKFGSEGGSGRSIKYRMYRVTSLPGNLQERASEA